MRKSKVLRRIFVTFLAVFLLVAAFPTNVSATNNGRGGTENLKVQLQTGGKAIVKYFNASNTWTVDTITNTNPGMATHNFTVQKMKKVQVHFEALPGYYLHNMTKSNSKGYKDGDAYKWKDSGSDGSKYYTTSTTVTGHFKFKKSTLEVVLEPGGNAVVNYTKLPGQPNVTDSFSNTTGSNITQTYDVVYEGSISVTFSPSPGFNFDGTKVKFSGPWQNKSNPYTDNVFKASRTVKGTFSMIEYEVDVVASPLAGGAPTVNGDVDYEGYYGDGLQFAANPATGYVFSHWDPAIPATLMADGTYTAVFLEAIDVDVDVDPDAGGSATVNGSSSVVIGKGQEITLSTTPSPHYIFLGWYIGNDLQTSDNPATIQVDEDTTFVARFELDDHDIDVSVDPVVGGTATVNGLSAVTVGHGETVNLQANANPYYNFLGWFLGSEVTPESTATLYQPVVEEDLSFTAKFKLVKHEVGVSAEGGGSATVDGDSSSAMVTHGEEADFVAVPDFEHSFLGWFEDGGETPVSTALEYSPVIEGPYSLTAKFVKNQYPVSVTAGTGGTAYIGSSGITSVLEDYNTVVHLYAVADPDHYFVRWERDWNGSTKPGGSHVTTKAKLVGGEEKSFTAIFAPKDTFTVTVIHEDPAHTGDTITPEEDYYYEGQDVDVDIFTLDGFTEIDEVILVVDGQEVATLVDLPLDGKPLGQLLDEEDFPYSIDGINANYTFHVYSTTTYPVYDESDDLTMGSTSPKEQMVEEGEEATVEATPNSGYQFVGWYLAEEGESEEPILGELVSTSASYTFEVTGFTWLVGVFEPIPPTTPEPPTPTQYTLTVNVSGDGSVPGFEGTNTFSSGTVVNLNPTPDAGSDFTGWTGDTGSLSGNQVTITGNLTITANFGTEIEDEETPEAPVPDNLEDLAATPDNYLNEDIEDEMLPEAPIEIEDDELPETGGIPVSMLSFFGVALVGMGTKLRKKS